MNVNCSFLVTVTAPLKNRSLFVIKYGKRLAVEMTVKIIPLVQFWGSEIKKIWLLDIRENPSIYINSMHIEIPQSQYDILLTHCSTSAYMHICTTVESISYGEVDR